MANKVDWHQAMPGLEMLECESMARHTTFRIGGAARWVLLPENADEAAEILRICRKNGIIPFYLGNGSNLLVGDEGYDGVVVATARIDGIREVEGEVGVVHAGAGAPLPGLARFSAGLGLAGLEFASGIPGSVGGAVRMNAGAYGGELSQVVERVDCLDEDGKEITFTVDECRFGYRHSIFCEKPWLITGAQFRLRPGDRGDIEARMDELAVRRREKQPLEYPSAGSTFKRPAPKGGEVLYAAALIDGCGLKGLQIGGAQVSEKHAGFVINRDGATCGEVLALMEAVKEKVFTETGVLLEPEVEVLK